MLQNAFYVNITGPNVHKNLIFGGYIAFRLAPYQTFRVMTGQLASSPSKGPCGLHLRSFEQFLVRCGY